MSIGLAIGEKHLNIKNRIVFALIGDGAFQYSLQSLYTGVQQKVHVIIIVFQNDEYAILKQFSLVENTANTPGLNIPNIDIVSLSKGYGAYSVLVKNYIELENELKKAICFYGVSVIVAKVNKNIEPLQI